MIKRLFITLLLVFGLSNIYSVNPVFAGVPIGCGDIGGTSSGDDCTLNADYDCVGITEIDIVGDFTIALGADINCEGDDLLINVGGNLIVNGSIITDGPDGNNGDDITPCTPGTPGTNGGAGVAGTVGGTGGGGTNGTNAASAGIITLNIDGAFQVGQTGILSAEGGDGGTGGNACNGGVGGNGGIGQTSSGNRDGENAGNGGPGGVGGNAGTCSSGGSIVINSGTENVPGDVYIEGLISSRGGNGGNAGNGGSGGNGGTGGDAVTNGSEEKTGGNGGSGGNGAIAGTSTLGCNEGSIVISEDFILTSSGSINSNGGNGGSGGTGGNGGNGGNGGMGQDNGDDGTGGNGGNGGNGTDCSNGSNATSNTINSSGDVDIEGELSSIGGIAGTGGNGGSEGNGTTDGTGGTAGNNTCTDGTDGSNTINYCDTASLDTTGSTINPAASTNTDPALCKSCSLEFDKKILIKPTTAGEVKFDEDDFCDEGTDLCADDGSTDCSANGDADCRFTDFAVGWDSEDVEFQFCVNNTGDVNLVNGTITDTDVDTTTVVTTFETIIIPTGNSNCYTYPSPDPAVCDDPGDVEGVDMGDLDIYCDKSIAPSNPNQNLSIIMKSDDAELDCQTPGLNVVKSCDLLSGETELFEFDITATNTGTAKLINCELKDVVKTGQCPQAADFDTDPTTVATLIGMLDAGGVGSQFQMTYDNSSAGYDIPDESCNNMQVICNVDNGKGSPALDDSGVPIEVESTFDDTCTPGGGVVSDVTRGKGFYKVHKALLSSCLTEAGTPFDLGFVICDNPDPIQCLLGIFWTNPGQFDIPSKRKGKPQNPKRDKLCSERIKLAEQYISAVCNNELFGSSPDPVGCDLSEALSALGGTDVDDIKDCRKDLQEFNASGADLPFPDISFEGPATPGTAKDMAEDPTDPANCNDN